MFDCYLDESLTTAERMNVRHDTGLDAIRIERGHPNSRLALMFSPYTQAGVRQQLLQQVAKLVAEPVEYVHGDYHVRAITLEQALQVNRLVADWAHIEVHIAAERPGRHD